MKGTLIIAALFVGICFVSSAVGVGQIVQEHAFLARAESATGTVTSSQVDSSGNAVEFCPIVEFTTRAGEPIEFESDLCESHPNQIQIGQKVQVYYDPQNTKDVQRRDSNLFIQYLDLAGFPFFFGLLFLVIALFMVVVPTLAAAGQRRKKTASGAVYGNWDSYVNSKNEETVREVEARLRKQGK